MSDEQATPRSESPEAQPGSDTPSKATPFQMVLGAVFLLGCVAVCGGFFGGWFGKGGPDGLGVPREAVTGLLGKNGLAFKPGPDQRGFPSEQAVSLDGISTVQIVGSKDEIVYASIATDLARSQTKDQQTLHGLYAVSMVHAVVPDWDANEILEWINTSAGQITPATPQIERRVGDAVVKLTVTRDPLTMTVSVESDAW